MYVHMCHVRGRAHTYWHIKALAYARALVGRAGMGPHSAWTVKQHAMRLDLHSSCVPSFEDRERQRMSCSAVTFVRSMRRASPALVQTLTVLPGVMEVVSWWNLGELQELTALD